MWASIPVSNSGALARPVGPATRRTTRASAHLLERLIFADRSLVTRTRIEHALAVARQPGNRDVMYETARALATGRGVRREWRERLTAEAARLRKPTLLVWGDRDRVLPVRHMNTARRLMPHARSHVFTDTGHMPQIERPDEC